MEVAYAPTVHWQKLRGNGHITYSIGPMTNMTTNQCLPINKHDLRDVNSDQTLHHYFISGISHLVILLKVGSCDVGQSRNRYCIETLYTDAHGLAILHAWVHHGIPATCTGNTCFRRPPRCPFSAEHCCWTLNFWESSEKQMQWSHAFTIIPKVTIAGGDFNGARKRPLCWLMYVVKL